MTPEINSYWITEAKAFWKFPIITVREDSPEYGDHLLLHPEEIERAKEYSETHLVFSVYETALGRMVETEQPCSFEKHPAKVGYFVSKRI